MTPNQNSQHIFNKLVRPREEHKEIAGQFRFQPRTSVHRVLESLQNREQMYLKKEEILSETLGNRSTSIGGAALKNFTHSGLKLKPLFDTHRFMRQDPSLISLTPRQIVPSFHRKSHFNALTSLYLKQGHGAKIINVDSGNANHAPGTEGAKNDDNKIEDRLVTAIGRNQRLLNNSISPLPNRLNKNSSIGSTMLEGNSFIHGSQANLVQEPVTAREGQ